MIIEMRWLRSYDRKGDGSMMQMEWDCPIYYTLQFRTVDSWEGNENITVPMRPVWTPWENIKVQEERLSDILDSAK